MTHDELLIFTRRCCGSPSIDEVTDTDLNDNLVPALQWLSEQLNYQVRTDLTSIALTQGQYEYVLPRDCAQLLWVEFNQQRINPASVNGWIRDKVNWRNAPQANPQQYAVQGRNLLLYPPPSSDALSTTAVLPIGYVATPRPLEDAGEPLLRDIDLMAAAHRAAYVWLGLHPAPPMADPNAAAAAQAARQIQQKTNLEQMTDLLVAAKRYRERPIQTYTKHLRVHVFRRGVAR